MQATASIYTDFQGLTELRGEARKESPEALRKAAEQFEALFLQSVLKSMRDAGGGGGLFENHQTELYTEMYDKQLAISLAREGKGVGLADMLVKQLQGLVGDAAERRAAEGDRGPYPVPERRPFATPAPAESAPEPAAPAGDAPQAATPGSEPARFESPEAFIRHLWPHAERAARRLGADPRALLAQAALETGWGQAVIRHGDGRSSHNLFNIKANHGWSGDHVVKQTLEYRDGVAVKEQAPFRAYDSYAQSFQDYVQFLQDNPRYQEALQQAHDPEAFIEALHEAGYATDPAYSDKISDIMGRDLLVQLGNRSGRTVG